MAQNGWDREMQVKRTMWSNDGGGSTKNKTSSMELMAIIH